MALVWNEFSNPATGYGGIARIDEGTDGLRSKIRTIARIANALEGRWGGADASKGEVVRSRFGMAGIGESVDRTPDVDVDKGGRRTRAV